MAAPGVFDNYRRIRKAGGAYGEFAILADNTPLAASQTVKKYDILSLNSSGQLQQSIALPGSNSTGTLSGGNLAIAGVALCDWTTDSNGNLTVPNQAGWSGTGAGVASTTNFKSPPVARIDDVEMMMRLYNASLTSTQQDDVVIGYSRYQFQRWRDTSASSWWYSLTTTTTNGECMIVERAAEAVGSALTDNYGLLWVAFSAVDAIRQV